MIWKDETGEWNVLNIVSFVILIIIGFIVIGGIYLRMKYRFFYTVRDMYIIYQYHRLLWAPYKPINSYKKLEYLSNYRYRSDVILHELSLLKEDEQNKLLETLSNFMKDHFVRLRHKKHYECIVDSSYFHSILSSHDKPSYISCLYDVYRDVKSIFTLYPIYVYEHKIKSKEMMYYLDYSVTHPKHRHHESMVSLVTATGVKMIEKFVDEEYPERETASMGFIFKTENTKLPMLPILQHDSLIYDIDAYIREHRKIPNIRSFEPLQITRVSKENITRFKHALKYVLDSKESSRVFCITPCYNTLYEWVMKDILYVYMVMMKDDVYGLFFFKDDRFVYKGDKMIESIGTVWFENQHDSIELKGDIFMWCAHNLKRIHGFRYHVFHLLGEENENIRNEMIKRLYFPKYQVTNYYYTVNYIQRPYKARESFIIL